jgi:hypothetical protein
MDRWTTIIISWLCVFNSRFLTNWCGLFVVRLLIALVCHVSVRLSHVHARLVLIPVVGLVRLVRVWGLGRLHQRRSLRRRRKLALALVLRLARSVLRHLGIAGALRWSHLLIVVGLVRLRHLIHAGTTRRCERSVASIRHGPWTIASIKGRIGWGQARLLAVVIRGSSTTLIIGSFLVVLVPVLGRLVLTAPHANITADADTTTLLGDHTT